MQLLVAFIGGLLVLALMLVDQNIHILPLVLYIYSYLLIRPCSNSNRRALLSALPILSFSLLALYASVYLYHSYMLDVIYIISFIIFTYIAIPHIATLLPSNTDNKYKTLFSNSWNNFFILLIGCIFSKVALLLMWLLVVVVTFLGVDEDTAEDIFFNSFVIVPVIIVVSAYGIKVAQENSKWVHHLREIVLLLCKLILPITAVLVLVMEVVVPIKFSLGYLSENRALSLALFALSALFIFTINGVFQDGEKKELLIKINIYKS